jgi:hypothetical protein
MYFDYNLQNFQNWFLPSSNVQADEEQSDVSVTKSAGAGQVREENC